MKERQSEDPAAKMDVHQTARWTGALEDMVGLTETGRDITLMDPGANPQLKERTPMRERRPTVTGNNQNYIMVQVKSSLFVKCI